MIGFDKTISFVPVKIEEGCEMPGIAEKVNFFTCRGWERGAIHGIQRRTRLGERRRPPLGR